MVWQQLTRRDSGSRRRRAGSGRGMARPQREGSVLDTQMFLRLEWPHLEGTYSCSGAFPLPGLLVLLFLKTMPTERSGLPTWPRSRMKQSPVLKLSQLSARSVARIFFFPFTWYSFLMASGVASLETL